MGRLLAALDRWQRRHATAGFAVAVAKKHTEDRASRLAALVAYYAFLSLFPLLLAFVSILGFVLDGNPQLREDVVDTTLARIPVIGPQLQDQVHPLSGSGVALAIGLAGALWAGLGVSLALGNAFAEIWDVPRIRRPNGFKARLRGLAVLAVLAFTLIAATVLAGLNAGGAIGPGAQRIGAALLSLAVNVAALLTLFALLTPPRRIRDLWPGVILAAVGALALQSLGGWYVDHVIAGASATYGTFALVIGLLSWFVLGANLLLVSAEVNVVIAWRLWPRSLTGELESADRRALRRAAQAAQQDPREIITVSFERTGPS